MLGVDISRWQTGINYGAMTSAVNYVLLKAGGSNTGSCYTDSLYATHASGLGNRVPVGSYWMNGAGPVTADANYFLSILRSDADDFIVLDIESIDGYQMWNPAQAIEWFNVVKAARPGVPLYAYMNSSAAASYDWRPVRDMGVDLWVANYGPDNGYRAGEPSTGSWGSYVVHQYTQKGYVSGYSGQIDLNHALRNPAGTSIIPVVKKGEMYIARCTDWGNKCVLINDLGHKAFETMDELNNFTAATGVQLRNTSFAQMWGAVVEINNLLAGSVIAPKSGPKALGFAGLSSTEDDVVTAEARTRGLI